MRRKQDAGRDELEGIAQRLRSERPQASPLDLDRIKTTAMARAKAATGGSRAGVRRLAVAGLTVGTLFATSGGVLAWTNGGGTPPGNAAVTQYGNQCDVGNGNGTGNGNNIGNGGNAGNNNGNCNENSFNNNNNTNTNNTTNNYFGGTTINNTTVNNPAAASGVLASSTKKPATSLRHIKIHVAVPKGSKVYRVVVKVNGKRLKAVKGRKASGEIELTNLPCSSSGATKVVVTITLSDGKTVSASHTYHLCT